MSIGFRKSLFGFNSNDVLEYIEKSHRSFNEKEEALNEKLESLRNELNISKESYEKLSSEKEEISNKLAEFTEKYEEIERLSENIGKLYLVAQANAKAIMENSADSAEKAEQEVNRNLYSIDEAHISLQKLRQSITKTSDDFVAEVDRLISSLNQTREQIAANTDAVEAAKKDFTKVYTSITE